MTFPGAGQRLLRLRKTAIALLLVGCCCGTSLAADHNFTWPVAGAEAAVATSPQAPYLLRRGRIGVAVNMLKSVSALASGDTLTLELFKGTSYRIVTQSIKRDGRGVVTIFGRIEGQEMASFVLTAGPDSFLITLQDLDRDMLYRVNGDMARGEAEVNEVDNKKMPPRYDTPPLIPGE